MALSVSISKLGAIHQRLTEALVDLERLGEFAAAAHLAAALDAIEDRLDAQPPGDGPGGKGGSIAVIADQMRDIFGHDAEAVARRQLSAANGASLTAWAAIVNHIVG